jgi:DNA-binding response OmpR family regulator
MAHEAGTLSGYSFLVVEDEALQAELLNELLHSLGGSVRGTAYTYEQARNALDQEPFDCALLDVNLGGTLSFRIADLLRQRGTPFVFCTAYGDAVDVYTGATNAPRLNKPVNRCELLQAIIMAFASRHHDRQYQQL